MSITSMVAMLFLPHIYFIIRPRFVYCLAKFFWLNVAVGLVVSDFD
jgi:hypothetical protein